MSIRAAALLPHPPIVIPEIGGRDSEEVKNTFNAMEEVARRFAELEPDVLIIISPHGNLFRDAICVMEADRLVGDLANFGARKLKFNYEVDRELIKVLKEKTRDFPVLYLDQLAARSLGDLALDHGATVPLYFLDRQWKKKPKILHINYGLLEGKELEFFGGLLWSSIEALDREVVLVASGDLSHRLKAEGPYDFHEAGPAFDQEIKRILEEGSLGDLFHMDNELINNAGECGLRSLQIMAGSLEGQTFDSQVLNYEGPWGVGYMIAYFEEVEARSLPVELARKAIESILLNNKELVPGEEFKELLARRGACFVTLYKYGELRGCIGTIEPTQDSLAQEIVKNSYSAAFEDPRFPRLKVGELKDLVISVDELGPVEPCSLEDLDPKNYGVIVKKDFRRGLLLPDIAGVDTVEKQVEIARNKAGIGPKEPLSYYRFKVIRHGR